jgi:hypothetical protein
MGMDMNGSIQTIFIILIAVLLSGSCVCLLEYYRWEAIYMVIGQLFIMLTVKVRSIFIS